ncbi:MAG: (Fe-S)-binding protein, partial [Dehalococcoidales bacterium]|nr:(Fe-S)-binding protein [Dehalococcoidales bacterium]
FGVADGLGHQRLSLKDLRPQEFYPGLIHFLIFTGCIVLLLASFLDFISHYFFHFLHGSFYLGYSLVVDVFGLLVLLGVVLALMRRYLQRPERLDNKAEDLIALLFILVVVASGFLVEGLRIAATELKTNPDWAPWSPGGYVLALVFSGLSQSVLLFWHHVTWWLHALISLGAIIYISLSWNRLWHIIVSTLNVFFRNLEPRGALTPIDIEATETFGAAKIEDFSWKHLLDLDACTRCGRCQDSCPAYLSGKPLSPKKVIQDLKGSLLERGPALLQGKTGATNLREDGRTLIGEVVSGDEIWNCTTCYACQEVCPVYIEPMAKIVEMRRNLVLEQASIPDTVESALKSIEARGHPWRGTTLSRTGWAEGLKVKTLADDRDIDVLFWVGCTEALEERSTRVAQAIARILKLAGVNFGILGMEETCCGDPARRLGNEYLFQLQAQGNITLLKHYGIKKIVTGCPHCYNTLKHEYPPFGGDFEVVHHTKVIADLMREGKLSAIKSSHGIITYHDPCYLGRYNYTYDLPRQILHRMPGTNLVEMAQNRERSFCCGAGGGHLWLEEQKQGQRINEIRTEQVMALNASVVATACPYCQQMFEDGIKSKEMETSLKAMDIAELIAEAID